MRSLVFKVETIAVIVSFSLSITLATGLSTTDPGAVRLGKDF